MPEEHTQCVLKCGKKQDVAWIPKEYAVIHKIVPAKDGKKWHIVKVGRTVPSSYLKRYDKIAAG